MKTQKNFIQIVIIDPIKNNITLLLLILGVVLLVIGGMFGKALDALSFIPVGFGDVVKNSGTSVLGAGIFSVIMKSGQFTQLFQDHIFEVINSPDRIKSPEELNDRWHKITNSILSKVLPNSYSTAATEIKNNFFTDETHFHFEDVEISYKITVEKDNNVKIINTLKAFLVVSPNQDNPILEQNVSVDGNCRLISLIINSKIIDAQSGFWKQDPKDSKNRCLSLDLKPYFSLQDSDSRRIKFERTLEMTQNLSSEPFIFGKFTRYILGAQVSASITEDHQLHFCNSGVNPNISPESDGLGTTRWLLAENKKLLLPGMAYIIVISPIQGGLICA